MTSSIVHLGLDIAKATLVGHLAGQTFTVSNDPAGFAQLRRRIRAARACVQVICEATGGYERRLCAALHAASIAVTVLNPQRARELARGLGWLAKTDALDAQVLAEIGRLLQPKPTAAPAPEDAALAALVLRREQLCHLLRMEKQHREHAGHPLVRRDLEQSVALLQKRVAKLEALIDQHLAACEELAAKVERLEQAPGIGRISAATLVALLPELGHASRTEIAALAGVAPLNCDSGPRQGQRHLRGGRPRARRILYLCAWSAIRHHPKLSAFYQHLRATGKAANLALIAVARKLLIYLNSALKNPEFTLA
jgi:transposase